MPDRGHTTTAPPAWVSYDEIPDSYERFHVRKGYALLARDLVAAMGLPDGATVLDVGTGTGEVALVALARSALSVVGVDPSCPMLRLAAKKGLRLLVAGEVPPLPFPDRRFDAVMAGLVLSHLQNYEEALADMARVLKRGGKLGVTAWAARSARNGGAADLWRPIAESFVGRDALRSATSRIAPWEGWFSDPDHIADALIGAGLRAARIERHDYRVSITAADYLARMASSGWGRFMRDTLDGSQWAKFQCTVAERFAESLPRRFTISPSAYVATALR